MRPSYRAALAVGAAALLVYLLTLAPTVTLWDAGEFLTAARTLGIPHPPGTPLVVLLGHVWGQLLFFGNYAWRLNLLSALSSAATAGFFYLIAERALAGEERVTRTAGAAAAALLASFTFTHWQNSNETEVYALATTGIAGIAWLALRWRDQRAEPGAARLLLLAVYILGLAVGAHLLTLLVGPALSLFVWHVLRGSPAADPAERQRDWAVWGGITSVWALLVAVGLGSTWLTVVGVIGVAAALGWGVRTKAWLFPAAALLVAAVGISTYLFLYIRSAQGPWLDSADPETWGRLLGVIHRVQYPVRSPIDNPLFSHGDGNPGRTLVIFAQQIVNYAQYFNWQWGRALGPGAVFATALFAVLGAVGFTELYRRERAIFVLLGAIWLVTGFGLVVYMNFKPGYSLFWGQYPSWTQHEVRERDYFFTVSFLAWALASGVGLVPVARSVAEQFGTKWRAAAAAILLLPLVGNWSAASRRGADATLARDVAWNVLQSVEPYGILFTQGDNDTYPLWYAQQVEGLRRDVTVVNLSLANTDWYLRSLRDHPPGRFDTTAALSPYVLNHGDEPRQPVIDLPDSSIAQFAPVRVGRGGTFRGAGLELLLPPGQVLLVRDQAMLVITVQQLPFRGVYFAFAGPDGFDLRSHLVRQGLVLRVVPGDALHVPGVVPALDSGGLDTTRTAWLLDSVYHYGGLDRARRATLEGGARQMAASFAGPYVELGAVAERAGDVAEAARRLARALALSPSPQLAGLVHALDSVAQAPRPAPPQPRRRR